MKLKRQAKILEIIQRQPVDTQEELQRVLKEDGFLVTQATVSRDIKEMRLVKVLDTDGRYRYSVERKEGIQISSKFHSLFADTVVSVSYAANIVVVKCLNGMAGAVCAAMDSLHWEGLVGTLAGDDTFIGIAASEQRAADLTEELRKLMRQ
ncbi:MAG: arginine repressor [Clostridia bacterium]|nr:arginine repressor [Clostridia bacterium]